MPSTRIGGEPSLSAKSLMKDSVRESEVFSIPCFRRRHANPEMGYVATMETRMGDLRSSRVEGIAPKTNGLPLSAAASLSAVGWGASREAPRGPVEARWITACRS